MTGATGNQGGAVVDHLLAADLETYLREHGWENKDDMASVPAG